MRTNRTQNSFIGPVNTEEGGPLCDTKEGDNQGTAEEEGIGSLATTEVTTEVTAKVTAKDIVKQLATSESTDLQESDDSIGTEVEKTMEYRKPGQGKKNLGCFFVGTDNTSPPGMRGNRLLSNSEQPPESELPPEVEEGNIEYKLKLVNPTSARLEHLVTQMKWRLREGQGEALYEIGVHDNGQMTGVDRADMDSSLQTLLEMSKQCDADITVLKECAVQNNTVVVQPCEGQEVRYVAEVLIRRSHDEANKWTDVRIAMLGNVDAGKSTLCGVLTHGELDNGSGKARLNLFRHLHEIQSGHTSSISREILGFDQQGRMFNYENHSIESILDSSSKVITFIDLAGSQKYLKTTVFGLTGHSPDYAALVVNTKTGLVGTFREHLGLTVALRVPCFIVLTKIDTAPTTLRKRCVSQIESILKSPAVKRPSFVVNSLADAEQAAEDVLHGSRTPVFLVSAVTGENLALLQHFLSRMSPTLSAGEREAATAAPPRFSVDGVLSVTGPGTILTGLVTRGTIREDAELMLGPFEDTTYQKVKVASIHCNRLPRRVAKCGQSVSLAFHNLGRVCRKGMILQSGSYECYSVEEFEAEIFLLQHPSKLRIGFEATMFVEGIRQKVEILGLDKNITTGQRAKVKFKFVQYPDLATVGARLFFRNGRTKGMGTITSIKKIQALVVDDELGDIEDVEM